MRGNINQSNRVLLPDRLLLDLELLRVRDPDLRLGERLGERLRVLEVDRRLDRERRRDLERRRERDLL